MSRVRVVAFLTALAAHPFTSVAAQAPPQDPAGVEYGGVPALNYDADEGFGYGVIAEIYHYGPGGLEPYVYTVQPTVFLTTGGRRDFTLFFDAPHLIPGWRLDAYLASEQQIASPYYGIGNDAPRDEALEAEPNVYYYRFGRTRRQLRVNFQRPLPFLELRGLIGAGVAHVAIEPVPRDSGTTLLDQELGTAEVPGGWSNYVRLGLVRDTRDREVGPRRGSWSELLVQRIDPILGSESGYTRITATDRRYIPLGSRLVFANRILLQEVTGDAPFYDLYTVETSFKQQEGLGGAKTIRGLPKNRYVGEGMFLWNAELRWRAAEFGAFGKPFHVVLSAFSDAGRVWAEGIEPGSLLQDLHHGVGGGARLGMGENFIMALDIGHSSQSAAAVYIGLGYLY